MKTQRWLILFLGLILFTFACSLPSRLRRTTTPTLAPTSVAENRQLNVFETAWEAVRDQYVRVDYDGVDWEAVGDEYRAKVEAGLDDEAFNQLMRDLAAELPEGEASFQTRAERLEAETTDTSNYEGIGSFIAFRETPEPHVVILSVITGSPAEKAGLKAHDSIYAIDGQPIQADEAETVAERIRGPADTSVTITVQSPGGQRREVTIPRGRITATDSLLGNRSVALNIAYYRLPVVAEAEIADIIAQDLIARASTGDVDGVILDLRVTHSGTSGWPLDQMLTLFGNGNLGEFYTREVTETLTIQGQDAGGSQTVPLVLLIGPDTEGSPEIFAGALHGSRRATLVGLPTPGDVEGFSDILLPDGSRLFLATSSFRTRDGKDLAQSGLPPDVKVDADWDQIASDEDPVLVEALSLLLK
jgi:carboxyl-terminal processing protease